MCRFVHACAKEKGWKDTRLLTAASCREERGWGVAGTGARLYARPPVSTLLFQWDTRMCYCHLPSAKEPEWLRDNGKPRSVSESKSDWAQAVFGEDGPGGRRGGGPVIQA